MFRGRMDDYNQGTTTSSDNDDIFDRDGKEEYNSTEEESNSEEGDSNEESDDSEESDDTEGGDSEEADPWAELIHEAATEIRTEYQELVERFKNDGFGKIDAKKQAFLEILPKLRQEPECHII